MIAKDYRFKSWDGFIQIVLKKGDSYRSGSFSLRSLPATHPFIQSRFKSLKAKRRVLNKDFELSSKFGVVVSKKVSKSAVVRNRIRRRIYEWIRLNMAYLQDDHLNIIFVHTDSVAKMPFRELSLQLEELFKKASLLSSTKET